MATHRIDKSIQQGLLDRLIDLDPDARVEAPVTRAESLRQFRDAVKRDLEWLMNTIRIPLEIPETYGEINNSVLCYGLPDLSSLTIQNAADEFRLQRELEGSLKNFEPRLAQVRVASIQPFKRSRQSVTFRVEAMLLIEPAPERIAFDTVLEISKGAYSVKEA